MLKRAADLVTIVKKELGIFETEGCRETNLEKPLIWIHLTTFAGSRQVRTIVM
jgi:hypothetical protein